MCPEMLDKVNKRNTNVNMYSKELREALKKEHFKKAPEKFYSNFVNYCQATEAHLTFPFDDVDFQLDLESFRLELTEEELVIFELYFIQEYNQEEVAVAVGLTQGRISQKIRLIEEKYVEFMAESDEV